MLITNFSLFLSITFIVSASPGPVMLSCMANGARYGLKKTLGGMIGASVGNLCLVALSALGLGFLVNSNDFLFFCIKWIGAAYLIFLGVQIIRQPIAQPILDDAVNTAHFRHSIWLSGFIIAISNPKGLLYFAALFPQFISYHEPLPIQFIILTITFLVTDMTWMVIYAAAGKKIMRWLKTPVNQIRFNRVSGLILIIVGILMALGGKN